MTYIAKLYGICLILMTIGMVVFAPMWSFAQSQAELRGKMAKIGMEFSSGKLSEAQFEKQFLNLQAKYKSPEQKGQIYLYLAETLAIRTKQKDSTKIIKYSQLALRQQLGVLEAVRAYRILGDGFAREHHNRRGKDWVNTRREIVDPYLRGLRMVLDNLTIDSRQPLPAVGRYLSQGGQEERQQMEEDHQREVVERARVEFQNKLLNDRDAFIRDCADEYSHAKDSDMPDRSELERLSRGILSAKYDAVTEQILAKVEKKYAERKEKNQKIRNAIPHKDLKIIPGRRKQAVPRDDEARDK